ncbi:MAG TPA: DUF4397 domain-containing protein [Nocardioides sp.]|uniref:DUF4397 domain-containing protein n=1 Tax=Nocardioides sp. TaxID=35761 RepID=UPI002C2B076B|nr:DUF4397 domain-containing protein [Nocardioides sp.]HQR25768.1 DUF4397 domain-containing protein [Nocardioides sp.]
MRNLIRTTVALAALTGAGLALAPAAQAADDAQVSVLHGVPGAVVDVYVNGEVLLTDFQPGTLTDPVALPAGDYDLTVVAAGDGADGEPIMEADGVGVPAGANITVVAHLDESGTPVLTPYVNDTSSIAAGQARLTVRHDAAAPAVDVRAGGDPVFTDLANPDEASADIPAGTVSADVVLAGTDQVVIGPADLDLTEGVHTIVYAWGSAEDGTLDLAVQTIGGMHSAPSGVPGGTGGQAAGDAGAPLWVIGAGGLVAALLASLVLPRPARSRVK